MFTTIRRCVAVSLAVLPCLAGAAAAQDIANPEGRAYASCQNRFAIIFPADPMAREVAFATAAGASVTARQFYHEQGSDRYSVTVVHLPDGPALDEQIIDHAADRLRSRGEVRFQFPVGYSEGVRGRQLLIAEPNGQQLRGSVYMHDHRIYITQVSSAVGDTSALQFDQSITLIDDKGVDLDTNARRVFTCR